MSVKTNGRLVYSTGRHFYLWRWHRVLWLLARFRLCGYVTISLALALFTAMPTNAASPPQATLDNGVLHATVDLPDKQDGFYRGTRFDWAGVIASLTFQGHEFYGRWFNKTDPHVIDFVFSGDDIVAGPCSAITGPVEEFTTAGKGLGFAEAKAGGTFLKIGVGVLRRPDDQDYTPYRLYEIVDTGHWEVDPQPDSIAFIQTVTDPLSGYGYRYEKRLRLTKGAPELVISHKLENTGHREIHTSVYDHNFLVLDKHAVGPAYRVTFPFTPKPRELSELARVDGSVFTYNRPLKGRESVQTEFTGFGKSAADYRIAVENRDAGTGLEITGDRPLSRLNLWSIRSVLAVEPFIEFAIEPHKSFSWSYTYHYGTGAR